MARFLAYTSPARGHLYPIMPTLLELRQRGHDVHVRTLASEVAVLQEVGLEAGEIAPSIEDAPLDDWKGSTPEDALARVFAIFTERVAHEVPDFQRAIAEVDPDMLVVDITTPGAAAVAESTGMPWAQTIPLFQHFSLERPASDVVMVPFGLGPAGLEVLNVPRHQVGLPPLAGPENVWRAPLHLYYTAPPFESKDLAFPPSFRLVGPGVWDPPLQAPEWLDEIEKPLVLVTASSEFQRDDALVETVVEALSSEEVEVVITTAAHDPERFPVPSNMRITRWLPHGATIAKAACVVCHGGMGITQKALAAGVPVCIVPFGRDQFEVAGRVLETGAGTAVFPDALDPAGLRSAIRAAMTMRAGAEKVAAGFARAGGPPVAAAALESLFKAAPKRRHAEVG